MAYYPLGKGFAALSLDVDPVSAADAMDIFADDSLYDGTAQKNFTDSALPTPPRHPAVTGMMDAVSGSLVFHHSENAEVKALGNGLRRELFTLLYAVLKHGVHIVPSENGEAGVVHAWTPQNFPEAYSLENANKWNIDKTNASATLRMLAAQFRSLLNRAAVDEVEDKIHAIIGSLGMEDIMQDVLAVEKDENFYNVTRRHFGLQGGVDRRFLDTQMNAQRDVIANPVMMNPVLDAFREYSSAILEHKAGGMNSVDFHHCAKNNPALYDASVEFSSRVSDLVTELHKNLIAREMFYVPRHPQGTTGEDSSTPLNEHDLEDIRSFLHWCVILVDALKTEFLQRTRESHISLEGDIMTSAHMRMLSSLHEALYHSFRRSRFPGLLRTIHDCDPESVRCGPREYMQGRMAKAVQENQAFLDVNIRLTRFLHGKQFSGVGDGLETFSGASKILTMSTAEANHDFWTSQWIAEGSKPCPPTIDLDEFMDSGGIPIYSPLDKFASGPLPTIESTLFFFPKMPRGREGDWYYSTNDFSGGDTIPFSFHRHSELAESGVSVTASYSQRMQPRSDEDASVMFSSATSYVPLRALHGPDGAWMQWQDRNAKKMSRHRDMANAAVMSSALDTHPYYRESKNASVRFFRIAQAEDTAALMTLMQENMPSVFFLFTEKDVQALECAKEVHPFPQSVRLLLESYGYKHFPEGQLFYAMPDGFSGLDDDDGPEDEIEPMPEDSWSSDSPIGDIV